MLCFLLIATELIIITTYTACKMPKVVKPLKTCMLTICEQHSKNIYTLINVTHKLSSLSQTTVLGTQGDIKVPQRERSGASHMWVTKNDLSLKL